MQKFPWMGPEGPPLFESRCARYKDTKYVPTILQGSHMDGPIRSVDPLRRTVRYIHMPDRYKDRTKSATAVACGTLVYCAVV